MSDYGVTPQKHRRKKLSYLDGLTFIDGTIVLGSLVGIAIVLIIMILILLDLYKMLRQ